MKTVIETPFFQRQVAAIWSEREYLDFTFWIAQNPEAGDVVRQTTPAARKVRWSRSGTGKRGGARVIYYYLDEDESVLLAAIYTKSTLDTLSAKQINQLAKGA